MPALTTDYLRDKIAELEQQREQQVAGLYRTDGALQALRHCLERLTEPEPTDGSHAS